MAGTLTETMSYRLLEKTPATTFQAAVAMVAGAVRVRPLVGAKSFMSLSLICVVNLVCLLMMRVCPRSAIALLWEMLAVVIFAIDLSV